MSTSEDEYLLVVAIDFGTTFSGYALSFRDKPDDIRMNKSWGEGLGFQSYKTPTSVLTDEEGDFVSFGFEAEKEYTQADSSDGLLLYRHFKMMLYNSENLNRNALVSSVDGTISPALQVFAHALRYLKDHIFKHQKTESGRKLRPSDIRWVLTVPAIWGDRAKQFMREAAFKAGCVDSVHSKQLRIALEPEAASLCCRRLDVAQYEDLDDTFSLEGSVKYLIVDCGGGTTDVTAHVVDRHGKVSELTTANGGPWGGTQVDKNFISLLQDVLGANFLNHYRQEAPFEWLSFMTSFESMKKSLKSKKTSKITLPLMYNMLELFPKYNGGKTIKAAIGEASDMGVKFNNGNLVVQHDAAIKLIQPVIDAIVGHVQTLTEKPKLKGLKYIFMVGGLSESELLQEAMKEALMDNDINVLIPSSAQIATLKGAVLYGHYPGEIFKRACKYTYGSRVSEKFDPKIHDQKQKMCGGFGEERCDNIFDVYIEKGEMMEVGQKQEFITYAPYTDDDTHVMGFYTMDEKPQKPVQYTTDPKVHRIGSIKLQTPKLGMRTAINRRIKVQFEFGDTEIFVEAIYEATGDKATTTIDYLEA